MAIKVQRKVTNKGDNQVKSCINLLEAATVMQTASNACFDIVQSPLENHHCSAASKMLRDPEMNFLLVLDQEERSRFRKVGTYHIPVTILCRFWRVGPCPNQGNWHFFSRDVPTSCLKVDCEQNVAPCESCPLKTKHWQSTNCLDCDCLALFLVSLYHHYRHVSMIITTPMIYIFFVIIVLIIICFGKQFVQVRSLHT